MTGGRRWVYDASIGNVAESMPTLNVQLADLPKESCDESQEILSLYRPGADAIGTRFRLRARPRQLQK